MPRKAKSEARPSKWETVCYVTCADGIKWIIKTKHPKHRPTFPHMLSIFEEKKFFGPPAHGNELEQLRDSLNILLPIFSDTPEQPR